MKTRTRVAASALATTLGLSLAACSGATSSEDAGAQELSSLRYMVPNAPGSGWDTTARTAARSLQDADLVNTTEVFNVDGANGTVGLARLANEEGNSELVMQMGLGLVGSVVTLNSDVTLEDVTPIAKMVEDYEVVFVNADSPYQTIDDLVEAWKANATDLAVGGGSSPGGADHLVPVLMAKEVGIKTTEVAYTSLGGSGVMPAVLGGQVDFAVTGAGDVLEQADAGKVRVLAVSGEERLEELPDVPTLKESGVDVTLTNWRGVVAPPGITEEEKARLVELFDELHASPQWQEAVEANGWGDAYISGEEFGTLVEEQDAEVRQVIAELGL